MMLDRARSYYDDFEIEDETTEVIDVEEPPLVHVTRNRVPTKELDVHVWLDDGWHRLDAGGGETACGADVEPRTQIATRMGRTIEHPLARCDCWTRKEREKADATYRQAYGRDYEP